MPKTANISARIEADLKQKAEEIFSKIGLTPSAGIKLLYKKVVKEGNLNFLLEVPEKKK
jgi:DNA-damage-inducible protein J